MTQILVVGGAGYIGSHMTDLLVRSGYDVVVLDSLITGHKASVLSAELFVADLGDTQSLHECFLKYDFAAVLYFAGFIQTQESLKNPQKYYVNNVQSTLNLLNLMLQHKINKFVFSSSAAVYGHPKSIPLREDHIKQPLNTYGHTKWMIEQVLQDYALAYDFHSISLRYFNAAGADPDGRLGECHQPETHLLPLALQVASGAREELTIWGNDYPTPDGTCVRDYIHVLDLCQAHLLALETLLEGGRTNSYNVGIGRGYSVLELIAAVQEVTGKHISIKQDQRRPGDPPILVADASLLREQLGWSPVFSDLHLMVQHAWQWEQKRQKVLGPVDISTIA